MEELRNLIYVSKDIGDKNSGGSNNAAHSAKSTTNPVVRASKPSRTALFDSEDDSSAISIADALSEDSLSLEEEEELSAQILNSVEVARRLDAMLDPDSIKSAMEASCYVPSRLEYRPRKRFLDANLDPLVLEKRTRRRKLEREWHEVRQRWKRRKYTYESEKDVGNVVSRLTQHHHIAQKNDTRVDDSVPSVEEMERFGIKEDQDNVDTGEDSVRNRLLSQLQDDLVSNASDHVDQTVPDVHQSYAESLDFYSLGYAAPRTNEIGDWEYQAAYSLGPTIVPSGDQLDVVSDHRLATLTTLNQPARSYSRRRYLGGCTTSSRRGMDEEYPVLRFHSICFRSYVTKLLLSGATDVNVSSKIHPGVWWRLDQPIARDEGLRALHSIAGKNTVFFAGFNWTDRYSAWKQLQSSGMVDLHNPVRMEASARRARRVLQENLKPSVTPWSYDEMSDVSDPVITPTCAYVFIQGTYPTAPIPTPTDVDGRCVSYCVMDRNSSVFHDGGGYAMATKWNVAALVVGCGNESIEDLSKFMTKSLAIRPQHTRFKVLRRCLGNEFRELPLMGFYSTFMLYASLAVNYFVTRQLPTGDDHGIFDCETGDRGLEKSRFADLFMGSLSSAIDHNGLEFFPRVHLSVGLVQIIRLLPEPAAQLFSTPINPCGPLRTPLDAFRAVLEYLETNDLIKADGCADLEDGVSAAQLEYAVFQASQSFSKCVDREPTSCVYLSWLLGSNLASLLLCSGNMIGSGARQFPSFLKSQTASQRMFLNFSESTMEDMSHEVRPMLPKFHDIRKEIAEKIKLLLQLHRHQPSQQTRLTLVSLLDWKEAIALLIGQPKGVENSESGDSLEDVYTMVRKALKTYRDELSLYHYDFCQKDSKQDMTAAIKVAMKRVEVNPGDICLWRELVLLNGSLATRFPPKIRIRCADCTDCHYFLRGMHLDHCRQSIIQSVGSSWGEELLWSTNEKAGSLIDLKRLGVTLRERMKKGKTRVQVRHGYDQLPNKEDQALFFNWLDSISIPEGDADAPPPSVRSCTYDERLSPSEESTECPDLRDFNSDAGPANAVPWHYLEGLPESEEIRAYSIYMLCFILGPSHPTVKSSILSLLKESIRNGTTGTTVGKKVVMYERASAKILEWLMESGLMVHKYLLDHIAVEECNFPDLICQEITSCVEQRGCFEAKYAVARFEGLKEVGVTKIREIYDVLVAAGKQPRTLFEDMERLHGRSHSLSRIPEKRPQWNPRKRLHSAPRNDGTVRPLVPLRRQILRPELFVCPDGCKKLTGYLWNGRLGFWFDSKGVWDPVLETTVFGEDEIVKAKERLAQHYAVLDAKLAESEAKKRRQLESSNANDGRKPEKRQKIEESHAQVNYVEV